MTLKPFQGYNDNEVRYFGMAGSKLLKPTMPADPNEEINALTDRLVARQREVRNMPIQIKAKMRCSEVKRQEGLYEGDEGYENVQLYAVYSNDPKDENFTYSKATPSADARLLIANSQAFGAFKEGKEYVVTFQEV